jgi:hypothetical protein
MSVLSATGSRRPQPVIDVAEMTAEELPVNGRRVVA